jgi:outer membrane autotransporter protein
LKNQSATVALIRAFETTRAGLSFGVGHTSVDFDDGASEDSKDLSAALFIRHDSPDWFASLDGFFGKAAVDTEVRPEDGKIAKSDYDMKWYGASFSAGKLFEFGGTRITPRLGLGYLHLDFPGLTETGAEGWNRALSPAKSDSLELRAGVNLAGEIEAGGIVFSPRLNLGLGYETLDTTMLIGTRFADWEAIAPHVNETPDSGRLRVFVELGATLTLSDKFELFFDYGGSFGRRDRIRGATVGASFAF